MAHGVHIEDGHELRDYIRRTRKQTRPCIQNSLREELLREKGYCERRVVEREGLLREKGC